MSIFKVFDLLTKVGLFMSFMGQLITRLGTGGSVLLPPATGDGSQTMSQDSSNLYGVEDEKPVGEETPPEVQEEIDLSTNRS